MILIYDFPLSQLQAFPEERQLAQILTLCPLSLFPLATCTAKLFFKLEPIMLLSADVWQIIKI